MRSAELRASSLWPSLGFLLFWLALAGERGISFTMSSSDFTERKVASLDEAVARALANGARYGDLVILMPGRGEPHMSALGIWVEFDRYISADKAFLIDTRKLALKDYKLEVSQSANGMLSPLCEDGPI
jgi:hypothetical protein